MPGSLSTATERRLDDFLYDLAREEPMPGLSVAITDDEETLYETGIGSRDLAENRAATPDTLYGIGSCTKSFAAMAAMQLADDGALDPDDPVVDHLDVDVPEAITLHHLMSHTSGYPSLAVSEALIARRAGLAEAGVPLGDWDDFHAHLEDARDEVAADPGDRFAYFNTGYSLLGLVIEAVDGRPFIDYVTQEILRPLGMTRSTFDPDAFEDDEDHMTPYAIEDDELEATPLPIREVSAAPGGILSSVSELTHYLRLYLNGGEHEGRRLVSEDGLDRMAGHHAETPDGPYGYGLRTRETAGYDLLGHSGSIGVSSAYFGVCHEEDLGIAVAANASPEYALAVVGQAILAILVGDDPDAVPFFERRDRFDRLTGEYENYRGIRQATVSEAGGILRLEFEDAFGGEVPLIPVDGVGTDDEFYALSSNGNRDPVRFETDGDDVSCYYDRWRLHKQ
jgi:CubicO group peptidase (beta-lactamase class C family)